jgi:Bacterial SH3 domain
MILARKRVNSTRLYTAFRNVGGIKQNCRDFPYGNRTRRRHAATAKQRVQGRQIMRRAARLRDAPEPAADSGSKSSLALAAPIPLDLMSLIAPYREHRRLVLRLERLPQLARLSAGQNNGDNSWSLALHDLDGLLYFPPDRFFKEHILGLRVIAQGDSDASTVALLELRIAPDGADATRPALDPRRALLEEVEALKALLATRDAELAQMKASSDEGNIRWQQKLEQGLKEAERAGAEQEASRLAAAKAALQAEHAHALAQVQQRSHAEAQQARASDTAMLHKLQQDLASTKALVAEGEGTQAQLRVQLADLRRHMDAEIASAKKAAASEAAQWLKTANAARTEAVSALADMTARCQAAEAALASARSAAASAGDNRETAELRIQLEALRRQSAAQISAAQDAALAAQKSAEGRLSELAGRCQAAETALAASRAAAQQPQGGAELVQLRQQLEIQRQDSAAALVAAMQAAATEAAANLKAAETAWKRREAQALAEMTARLEAAETALAGGRAAPPRNESDGFIQGLQREIETLRRTLVDREVELTRANAALEQARRGESDAPGRDWQPLSNKPIRAEVEEPPARGHLVRDVGIIFAVVIGAVLLWPRLAALIPDDIFPGQSEQVELQTPPPVAKPPPKPTAVATRSVNLRAAPQGSAAILASLNRGAEMVLLGRSGNWEHVEIANSAGQAVQGWVYASYLQPGQPAATATTTDTP